jgi:hypothetical protein
LFLNAGGKLRNFQAITLNKTEKQLTNTLPDCVNLVLIQKLRCKN